MRNVGVMGDRPNSNAAPDLPNNRPVAVASTESGSALQKRRRARPTLGGLRLPGVRPKPSSSGLLARRRSYSDSNSRPEDVKRAKRAPSPPKPPGS